MFFFHNIIIIHILLSLIIIIHSYKISNDTNKNPKSIQTSRRQVINSKEKFHTADEHDLPAEHSKTYLLTMLPVDKGNHIFNHYGEQEWTIQKDTVIRFAVYGIEILNLILIISFVFIF